MATHPWGTKLPILIASCLLTRVGTSKSGAWQRDAEFYETLQSGFLAPQLTPYQFLMISSPSEKKITYAKLKNFKAIRGLTFPLVSSGLDSPRGLAYDETRQALYVADYGAQKIYRYRVYARNQDAEDVQSFANMELVSDGVRITILQGVPVSWLAVDQAGDVFYSDPASQAVGKIPYATVQSLVAGVYHAGDLSFLSEMELVKQAAASLDPGAVPNVPPDIAPADSTPALLDTSQTAADDPPQVSTVVHQIYEGAHNYHVESPGGLVTNGSHIFWTNTNNGTLNGSVVRGLMDPRLPVGSRINDTFVALALSNDTEQAFGIVKTKSLVVFSSQTDRNGNIYGLSEETGQVVALTSRLAKPRGLAWDGDQTVFVADQSKDGVWSIPVGRLAGNLPLSEAVSMKGAYGVAVLTVHLDHSWHVQAGAQGLRGAAQWWWTFSALVLASFGVGAL